VHPGWFRGDGRARSMARRHSGRSTSPNPPPREVAAAAAVVVALMSMQSRTPWSDRNLVCSQRVERHDESGWWVHGVGPVGWIGGVSRLKAASLPEPGPSSPAQLGDLQAAEALDRWWDGGHWSPVIRRGVAAACSCMPCRQEGMSCRWPSGVCDQPAGGGPLPGAAGGGPWGPRASRRRRQARALRKSSRSASTWSLCGRPQPAVGGARVEVPGDAAAGRLP
jgi:hypothetical protein